MADSSKSQTEPLPNAPRALSLDALRGLAILAMCLSGMVPEGLPNAMYHGYHPRFLPDAQGVWQQLADPYTSRAWWAALTWVDCVFPFFLFAMGAAIPLALGRKLDKGVSPWRVALGVLGRGITLIGFAIYIFQVIPRVIQNPPLTSTWCLGILGFMLLFPVLTRLPGTLNRGTVFAIRTFGVAACIGFVTYLNIGDGEAFTYAQNDIIILLLAHMAIAGSLIWLITRQHILLRLGTLILVFIAHDKAMLYMGGKSYLNGSPWIDWIVFAPEGWLNLTWINDHLSRNILPGLLDISVLYDFTWYKFLFVVIPGTIVGDLLRTYMQSKPTDSPAKRRGWGVARYFAMGLVFAGLLVVSLIGLQCHDRVLFDIAGFKVITPWATWLGVLPLMAIGLLLVNEPGDPKAMFTCSLFWWGSAWLVLGLLVEPLERGITKGEPSTLSFYWVTAGLAILFLGTLFIWIDVLGFRRTASLFVINGQNPMLAYAGIRGLLGPFIMLPLLAPLVGKVATINDPTINGWMYSLLGPNPWMLFIWAVAQTLLLGIVVVIFTRMRIIWRS